MALLAHTDLITHDCTAGSLFLLVSELVDIGKTTLNASIVFSSSRSASKCNPVNNPADCVLTLCDSGDYYPTTAAGRVFFIIYALVAVPIVASFAVQAVSQVNKPLCVIAEADTERL